MTAVVVAAAGTTTMKMMVTRIMIITKVLKIPVLNYQTLTLPIKKKKVITLILTTMISKKAVQRGFIETLMGTVSL